MPHGTNHFNNQVEVKPEININQIPTSTSMMLMKNLPTISSQMLDDDCEGSSDNAAAKKEKEV